MNEEDKSNRKWVKFDGIHDCRADVRMAYFDSEGKPIWVAKKEDQAPITVPCQPGFMWYPEDGKPEQKVDHGDWVYYIDKSLEECSNG